MSETLRGPIYICLGCKPGEACAQVIICLMALLLELNECSGKSLQIERNRCENLIKGLIRYGLVELGADSKHFLMLKPALDSIVSRIACIRGEGTCRF